MSEITIIKKIGTGGMGQVFMAKLVGAGGFEKIVAVKKVGPWIDTPDTIARLQTEANNLALLNHSNIVQVFDIKDIDGSLSIVMEYVEGHSLKEIIFKAKNSGTILSEEFVLPIVLQILAALQYAHSESGAKKRILHRDVSPHNIMITNNGQVKLLDFGVSKLSVGDSDYTYSEVFSGKFQYAALESLENNLYSPETDLYQLGLCALELLSGELVFEGKDFKSSLIERRDFKLEKYINVLKLKNENLIKILTAIFSQDHINCEKISRQIPIQNNPYNITSEILKITNAENVTRTARNKKIDYVDRNVFYKYKFLIGLGLIICLSGLAYSRFKSPSKPPLLIAIVGPNEYDISPENDDQYIDETPNELDNYSCELACYNMVKEFGALWYSDIDQLVKKPDWKSTRDPNQYILNNRQMQLDETSSVKTIISMCTRTPICNEFDKNIPKFSDAVNQIKDEKFKNFKQVRLFVNSKFPFNPPEFKKTFFLKSNEWLDANVFWGLSKTTSDNQLFLTEAQVNYNVVSIPADQFPKTKEQCKRGGDAFWLKHIYDKWYLIEKEFKLIIFPSPTSTKLKGLREASVIISVSENDLIFSKGLCLYERLKDQKSKTIFWVPAMSRKIKSN